MSFATLTIVLSGLGILVTGGLALIFWGDPIKGLEQTTHRLESLPQVMTNRYFFMTALAAGATVYGDFLVISFLFAGFAFMGFADAYIYKKAGTSVSKHIGAGVAAALVSIVAALAVTTSGASA